jgi:hypothetical protein
MIGKRDHPRAFRIGSDSGPLEPLSPAITSQRDPGIDVEPDAIPALRGKLRLLEDGHDSRNVDAAAIAGARYQAGDLLI